MAKTPTGGQTGPLDNSPQDAESAAGDAQPERRSGGRAQPEITAQAAGPQAASPQAGPTRAERPGPPGRAIGERKKKFIIAPRQQGDGMQIMGFAPLQLSSVEQALRANPDIEIVDTVGPRNAVGALGAGMGGGMSILVARMTEQKAGELHQQGQGRLLVERDQHLHLMDPALRQPDMVSWIAPHAGPALEARICVVAKDGTPLPEAEVSIFGSMLPTSGVTNEGGEVTLALYGETAGTLRGLYIKPKADYWSFYQRDPDISTDELNVVVVRALSEWPSLANFPRQQTYGWGQRAMRLDRLPAHLRGRGARIAIIDSGVATTHANLNGIRAGFDIINKKTHPETWNDDTLGHGSHCAGVIAAADIAAGIRGFAPEAEVHVCKLFPGGQVSQLIDALEYCIEQQIDVANLSLGGAAPSEALEQQIIRAKRAGVACIVAAGNTGGPVQYPASSPNVLAVAAIGKLNEFPTDSYHAETFSGSIDGEGYFPAKFSCFGAQVGVCAPGVAITSSVPPNNFAAWDGTSMAAPHITGLAALVLAHHPDFQGAFKMRGPERVERLFQLIRMSARRVSLGDQTHIGFGLPDVLVALGMQAPIGQSMAAQGLSTQAMMMGQGMQGMSAPIDLSAFSNFVSSLYGGTQMTAMPPMPYGFIPSRW